MPEKIQIAVTVKGIVQGVGFRPFVYNLANRLDLNGVVVNSTQGVEINLFGRTGDLDSFIETTRRAPPTLATVDSLEIRQTDEQHLPDRFIIGVSDSNGRDTTVISPDAAAIMAEHGLEEGIAVLFDGAGLGDDGTIWGGEFLHVKGADYERLGHLAQFQVPGGDLAGREIWRLEIALLAGTGIDISNTSLLPEALCKTPGELLFGIRQMMVLGINTPQTSSVGRLFDGVAALLGLRLEVDFEGQVAMELETLAWDAYERADFIPVSSRYFATIKQDNDNLLLDYRPFIYWLLEDLRKGVSNTEIALYFHLWLVRSTIKILLSFFVKYPATNTVLLGGGLFSEQIAPATTSSSFKRKRLHHVHR